MGRQNEADREETQWGRGMKERRGRQREEGMEGRISIKSVLQASVGACNSHLAHIYRSMDNSQRGES